MIAILVEELIIDNASLKKLGNKYLYDLLLCIPVYMNMSIHIYIYTQKYV